MASVSVTINDLIELVGETYSKEISLPNMTQTPYLIMPVDLKNQQYYFYFYWNIRHQRCYLSVFKLVDGARVYFIKNKGLVNGIKLSKYIFDTDWNGALSFESISDDEKDDYTINDMHEKFVLRYYARK